MSEPAIKEAMKCEMYFTQDEKLRRKYEIQEKARRDYISMMANIEDSHRRGREEGIQLGASKVQQEHILAMIREGLPYEMISRITHLSLEKIQEIAEKNK